MLGIRGPASTAFPLHLTELRVLSPSHSAHRTGVVFGYKAARGRPQHARTANRSHGVSGVKESEDLHPGDEYIEHPDDCIEPGM